MADGTPTTATTHTVTFFASGSNHSGEIHALGLVDGAHVGVVASRVGRRKHPRAAQELQRFDRKVFVDSGAFEEVGFNVPTSTGKRGKRKGAPKVLPRPGLPVGAPFIKKPLDDAYWRAVLRVYREIAAAHGADAYVVAPDCVAHQAETLRRLELYAKDVRDVAALGATVLVPVQKAPPTAPGALTMAGFWARAVEILGAGDWVPAIPMKKDATKLVELDAFVREVRPAAIHLLGIAPDTDDGRAAIGTVLAIVPDCRVSCDACLLMRWVGRSNGPGGAPRALTRLTDYWRRRLELDADGVGEHEVHVRKLLSMYHAAATYWTDLRLAQASAPERVDLPADVAADCAAEPWLLRFVAAIYAQDGGEGGAGGRAAPFDCLTLATLATNLALEDDGDEVRHA